MSEIKAGKRPDVKIMLAIVFYVLLIASYTFYTSRSEKQAIMAELDRDLLKAASSLPQVLAPDFFDRAVHPGAISEAEDRANITKLTHLANGLEMAYLYSLIFTNGAVYITSSSASKEELRQHTEVRYFTAYPETAAYVAQALQSQRPVFNTYTDRWGAFRHVYIPLRNAQGFPYIIAADQSISHITALMSSHIRKTVFSALLFFLAGLPFLIVHHAAGRKDLRKIRQLNQELAKDIETRKQLESALENRIVALTRPLDQADGIAFEDLFNLADIQKLQDEFAAATGLASIISRPDGTPITTPSNFCRLCAQIIRNNEKGRSNCEHSDACLGKHATHGPSIQPCLSGGLWDAGASITVGDKHIATWLAGQVRDETQSEDKMRAYARDIGADEAEVLAAFREVPAMSHERFGQIAQMLFTLANQLSAIAYQNIQQARFITERKKIEAERELLIAQLRSSIEQIKTLRGIVPICSGCKKIRDDDGYWQQVEAYVSKHTEAEFTHGLCPECVQRLYPEFSDDQGKPA